MTAGLTDEQLRHLLISVGTHRKDRFLAPTEVGDLLKQATASGATLRSLAKRLGIDGSMVTRFIRLAELPPSVKTMVGWGQSESSLSLTIASEIARLESVDEMVLAATRAISDMLRATEMKEAVQIRRRSGRPLEDVLDEVVGMRPRVVRRHVVIGQVTDAVVANRVAEMSEAQRASLMEEVADRLSPSLSPLGARLSREFFVMVGEEDWHSLLMANSEDFEAEVNRLLRERTAGESPEHGTSR